MNTIKKISFRHRILEKRNNFDPSVSCFAYTRIILWKTRIEKREAMRRETVRQLPPEITWIYLDGPPCKIQPNHASPRPIRVLMKTTRVDSLQDEGPWTSRPLILPDRYPFRRGSKQHFNDSIPNCDFHVYWWWLKVRNCRF